MERESNIFLMEIHMKGIFQKGSHLEKEYIASRKKKLVTKVFLSAGFDKDKENLLSQTNCFMKDSFTKIMYVDMES
jgi:hypothetical protein